MDTSDEIISKTACSCAAPEKSSASKRRWDFLAKSLRKHRVGRLETTEIDVSVRRFQGFSIFAYEKGTADEMGVWFALTEKGESKTVHIRLLHARVDPAILIGFNNTGNICIWPAEEILAFVCLRRIHDFSGKRICELGGGMTSLAGLMLAVSIKAETIHLTDGNEDSASNIHAILDKNKDTFIAVTVTSGQLLWGKKNLSDRQLKYDYIICADCLFFTESHQDLIDTISTLLCAEGVALLLAPRRGNTLFSFVEMAKSSFEVVVVENYDSNIWKKHELCKSSDPLYDENIHYPLLVTMKKKVES